jgi:hypothetical protein
MPGQSPSLLKVLHFRLCITIKIRHLRRRSYGKASRTAAQSKSYAPLLSCCVNRATLVYLISADGAELSTADGFGCGLGRGLLISGRRMDCYRRKRQRRSGSSTFPLMPDCRRASHPALRRILCGDRTEGFPTGSCARCGRLYIGGARFAPLYPFLPRDCGSYQATFRAHVQAVVPSASTRSSCLMCRFGWSTNDVVH